MRLVHVAEVDPAPTSGMGRVAWHWAEEARRRSMPWLSIGPSDLPPLSHPARFPSAARRRYDGLAGRDDCLVVHEPASGHFLNCGAPVVVLSHGIERRVWEMRCRGALGPEEVPSIRTRVLYPWWRLRAADRGLRRADHVCVLNTEDAAFVQRVYGRRPDVVTRLEHGVSPSGLTADDVPPDPVRCLFIGSWIPRKGTRTLVDAAVRLDAQGVHVDWTFAGIGGEAARVREAFPAALQPRIRVVPSFDAADEDALLATAHVFVLPSLFEGQPLALLQAMAAGRCCVTSDTCGQRDVIVHERTGLLHPPGDAAALAAALARCATDPALRLRLGSAARVAMAGRTWDRASSEALDLITRVFEHRTVRGRE